MTQKNALNTYTSLVSIISEISSHRTVEFGCKYVVALFFFLSFFKLEIKFKLSLSLFLVEGTKVQGIKRAPFSYQLPVYTSTDVR